MIQTKKIIVSVRREKHKKMAQPVIAYPGAKWRFWKYIKQYIPRDIKDWREPFFGGGSMSLSIADYPDFHLERMVVGDLAPEIWAFWVGCRDYAPDVVEIAKSMFTKHCPTQLILSKIDTADDSYIKTYNEAIEEGKAFWRWTQEVDCSTLSIAERAARTFLVNKISFSGMGDSGSISKDQFINFNFSKLDRILAAQPLLKKMEINNVSFEETMKDVDKDKSFVFLDPPYFRQETCGLYGRGGDTHKGFPHEHFAEFTRNTNCRWFITYDDSIKVRRMFRGKAVYSNSRCYVTPFVIPGGYTMAGKTAEDALAGEELFITNYEIDKDEEDIDF